jgi:acetoin utilization deacetylase AcuC-like enzyme
MNKFARTANALLTTCKRSHPQSSALPRPLVRYEEDFFRPLDRCNIPVEAWMLFGRSTDPNSNNNDFVLRFLQGQLAEEECRIIGFRDQTHRPELIERTLLEVAGTVLTCQLACTYGIAANVAGGTHHAHPTGGAGYTILNDLAIATHVLTNVEKRVERVLVIDCDVHQGDGTAKFGAVDPLKGKLFTLSLHCGSNYPHPKAESTFDVSLKDNIEDDDYMKVLEESVNHALAVVKPDFVLYDAGVDIYMYDQLGRLSVSEMGIRRRDRWVLDRCATCNIPVAAVVGGGYDRTDVDALARRHAIVHEECAYVWRKHRMWDR